ncbi:MAG: hypothetical protein F6J93_21140 [Oscillatoria sp. SIO1A7]|nr:hypothetical protein [Oscillatoria sp. SIO1A7]
MTSYRHFTVEQEPRDNYCYNKKKTPLTPHNPLSPPAPHTSATPLYLLIGASDRRI